MNSGAIFYVTKTQENKAASLDAIVDVEEDGHYYVHAGIHDDRHPAQSVQYGNRSRLVRRKRCEMSAKPRNRLAGYIVFFCICGAKHAAA